MSRRLTGRKLLDGLRYVELELSRPGLGEHRRAMLERQLVAYRAKTQGLCRRCGRRLDDLDSIARGLGAECASKMAPEDRFTVVEEADELADAGAYDDLTPDQVATA